MKKVILFCLFMFFASQSSALTPNQDIALKIGIGSMACAAGALGSWYYCQWSHKKPVEKLILSPLDVKEPLEHHNDCFWYHLSNDELISLTNSRLDKIKVDFYKALEIVQNSKDDKEKRKELKIIIQGNHELFPFFESPFFDFGKRVQGALNASNCLLEQCKKRNLNELCAQIEELSQALKSLQNIIKLYINIDLCKKGFLKNMLEGFQRQFNVCTGVGFLNDHRDYYSAWTDYYDTAEVEDYYLAQ